MIEITLKHAATLLPPRGATSHKGDFGHVLVVAGAHGYSGAARLAGEGALRSGAGLVTVAVPTSIQDVVAVGLAEAMTRGLPSTAAGTFAAAAAVEAATLARERSACVLGPGITTGDDVGRFLEGFLALAAGVPMVLDADALNLLASGAGTVTAAAPAVLTPHPGEAARLLGVSTAEVQADRNAAAHRLAAMTAGAVVLKGHETLVSSRDGRIAVNRSGGHGLAKGGSGDVLAGLIGGFLAQGLGVFEAACLGVFVHGLAGDIAQAQVGARAMLARDVLATLGEAWRTIEGAA